MRKIGFIGLGIMGKPMSLNLLKAGFQVGILAKSNAAGDLLTAGAISFPSARALTEFADIVITMLPDSAEVLDVVFRIDGILKGIAPGKQFIDMSTIAPATTLSIYEKMKFIGVDALDAPVSGGQVGAESASLSIMVGGSEEGFKNTLPVFQAMGKNIIYMGAPGSGQVTKACNQMIVGMTIQAVAEAFALGKKAGVDLEKMRDVLLGGFAQSKILDLHGKRIIEENFKPGFKTKLHKKDMGIALKTGDELGVELPGTMLVDQIMKKALEAGYGELDHSSLSLLLDKK